MNHYGTLRDYEFQSKDVDDIRGSDVYGINDEKLGDIDDVIFDHATGDIRYVVVDTGGWLSSNKFLIPAERLRPSTKHDDDYEVGLTKKQVESLPAYDEDTIEDRDRWNDYEKRYSAGWTDGEVMYRKDAPDRIVTPTNQELDSSTTARSVSSQPRTHLGERWNNFESGLRADRVRIVGSCGVCGISPSSAVPGTDRKRKVG